MPVEELKCPSEPAAARMPHRAGRCRIGPWQHLDAPVALPTWIGCDGFAGLIAYEGPDGDSDVAAPAW